MQGRHAQRMWGNQRTTRCAARAFGSCVIAFRTAALLVSCVFLSSCGDEPPPGTPAAFEAVVNFGEVGISPGQFSYPRCLDNDGVSLWVVDKSARVQRLDPTTGASLGGWRMPEWSAGKPTGVTVWKPTLSPTEAPTQEQDELVFVPDTHYHRVMVYRVPVAPTPSGRMAAGGAATPSVSTPLGDGQSVAYYGDHIGTLVAQFGSYGEQVGQFIYPTDVAILPTADGRHVERLFVSEYGGTDRITIWKPKDAATNPLDGGEYEVVGSFGKFGSSATAENVEFSRPQSIAVDSAASELIVTDACNHRIGRFTYTGELVAWIGGPENAGQGLGQMSYPYGLALVGDGTAFVAEFNNSRLQRFDLRTGRSLGIFGRRGRGPGEVMTPWGVTILGDKVYVLDSSNNRVQAFKLPKKPVAAVFMPDECHGFAAARTADRQAAAQQFAGVELGFDSALHRDDDDATVVGQATHFAFDVSAGHHVEDHVRAAAGGETFHFGSEVGTSIVDRVISAERHARCTLGVASCGRDHRRAGGLRDLDRAHADAARPALHEQRLTGLQPGAVENVRPDGEEGFGQAGRLDDAEALRHRQALADRCDTKLGIAAAGDERTNRVADFQACRGDGRRVTCNDRSGDFETGQVGCARWHRVHAFALQHVGPVHSRCGNPDQQLADTGHRVGPLGGAQHFRRAVARDFDRLHAALSLTPAAAPARALRAARARAGLSSTT